MSFCKDSLGLQRGVERVNVSLLTSSESAKIFFLPESYEDWGFVCCTSSPTDQGFFFFLLSLSVLSVASPQTTHAVSAQACAGQTKCNVPTICKSQHTPARKNIWRGFASRWYFRSFLHWKFNDATKGWLVQEIVSSYELFISKWHPGNNTWLH